MVQYLKSDLEFILAQIKIAEAHAGATTSATSIEESRQILLELLPNSTMPFGLRTVDGSLNNLVPGQEYFGAAGQQFPQMLDPSYRVILVPGPGGGLIPVSYAPGADADGPGTQAGPGDVIDPYVRLISNLIVDQTATNPAAVAAAEDNEGSTIVTGPGIDGIPGNDDDTEVLFLPNVTPDEGLSAPFNSWMTLFGQFFDHGLDLVNKGGSGTVFIPLLPDDPLYRPGSPTNFMVLTRATHLPGADGEFGTADDIRPTNDTSPFVDQNQTYSSHPSHQVFLRAYEFNAAGDPVPTGSLIVDRDLGTDGIYGTPDDVPIGGMATWGVVKAQARDILGIELDDLDALNLPLLATDQYGNFIPGLNGFPQIVTAGGLVEGNPSSPIDASAAIRSGHAFLADISHFANPVDEDGNPLTADLDSTLGNPQGPTTYDDELLDAHYIAGDGRANENIGLTAVHHVFHSEHNRLVQHTKDVLLADAAQMLVDGATQAEAVAFLNEWLTVDVSAVPATGANLIWDGERLFQAAKFGTEMQYQHLVFEEFARKVQPNVDIFISYDTTIDPSIVAEFAHTVYRFGHSMLTETVDRYDADFNADHIGLIAAFLNPTAFTPDGVSPDEAAGAIVRGMTRQVGNEIDEFVTEALRSNLLGLPLDLATINLARGRETGVPTLNAARREFYAGTGDSQLKPYTSWVDLAVNVKNPMSVVNFIAAYGTHESILAANTAADKRAAAELLVFGGAGAPDDRVEFLNSTGDWANGANGVTITGVDAIDLWIGGLAEKQMPFGGLLGSTFNFVFETQLEALQNGDRFYYLARTAGLNFLTQLEQNSFAGMIMRNTDVERLPGDVFSTPTWILEVDQTRQFHEGLGSNDPTGDNPFITLVVRDNPQTPGADTNYLYYTGEDHVVLGGTENGDTMIAGIGDDTLWGDGGNDRLEGGDGADQILGGDGDDILTDLGGDDLIQGGNGNDVINGGNGINLLLGGFGKDFIMAGEDLSEIFGGDGDDFLYGSPTTEAVIGNEGSDWIETGTADGAPGDNFDPNGLDLIDGHDVFIGSGGIDEFGGEGGDDIMVGGPGADRMEGMSGYDWVTYKNDTLGVTVDLTLEAFDETPIPPSNAAVMDRFGQLEGLSGSSHSDILLGDDADAIEIAAAGAQGSVLTSEGIARIAGLQDILGEGVNSFDGGNIILGGGGSDIIQGRGGNDIIDGDALLNVRISIRDPGDPEVEIGTADSMVGPVSSTVNTTWNGQQLSTLMLAGAINPSQLQIVREILDDGRLADLDTAVFSGAFANYQIGEADAEGRITIIDTVGTDGVDIVRNIERLQFSDTIVDLVDTGNRPPEGELEVFGLPATEDSELTVTLGSVTDPDNPNGAITGPISYVWQVEETPNSGIFIDIPRLGDLGEDIVASGTTFTPGDEEVGLVIRVKASYMDADGVIETVFSAPTNAVVNVNDAPTGAPIIDDTSPTEGIALSVSTASIVDLDGIDPAAVFTFQWQVFEPLTGEWEDIPGATAGIFRPEQAQVGKQLRVAVTYTDDLGTTETVFSAATTLVGDEIIRNGANDVIAGTAGDDFILAGGGNDIVDGGAGNDEIDGEGQADTLNGNDGNDRIFGGGGGDTITGGNGNDTLDGGNGNDTIDGDAGIDAITGGNGNDTLRGGIGNDTITGGADADNVQGGAGNDIFNYTTGDGGDTVDGGADLDTLRITGTDGDDQLSVVFNGTALTQVGGGGSIANVERITANLLGAVDTLTYSNASAAVSVNLATGTASGFTEIRNIENVTGGGGSDTLTGSVDANVLTGGGGADTLNGGDGDDTLNGGAGNDALNGGSGVDTATYAGIGAAVTVSLALATAQNTGGAGTDTLNSIENLIGGDASDTLTGSTGDNVISGGTGNDNISGGLGNDTLFGNNGGDTLNGGDGDDILAGGDGNDTVNGGAGNDTFMFTIGEEIDTVNGGADTDTLAILGTNAGNTLDVVSVTGVLTQFEGGGITSVESVTADLLGGNDTLSYSANTAANGVAVNLATGAATGFSLISSIENVTGGAGADLLTGSNGANTLNGGAGTDTLNGGAGADDLNGGTGADILIGGVGADTINTGATNDNLQDRVRFGAANEYGDTIDSFDTNGPTAAGDDRIEFSGALNTLFDDIVNNDTFQFVSGNGVNGGNTVVNVNTTAEALFLSGANGEGVTNGNLTSAAAVATEFNAEFAITAANGETTLLVINDTNGNNAALWQWTQAGGSAEIDANELILIAVLNANSTLLTDNLGLIP